MNYVLSGAINQSVAILYSRRRDQNFNIFCAFSGQKLKSLFLDFFQRDNFSNHALRANTAFFNPLKRQLRIDGVSSDHGGLARDKTKHMH